MSDDVIRQCLKLLEEDAMTTPTQDALAMTAASGIEAIKAMNDEIAELKSDLAAAQERAEKAEARAEANAKLLREMVDAWDNGVEDDSIIASRRVTDAFIKARAAIAEGKKPALDDEREAMQRRERAYERGAPQDHQADAERRAENRAAVDQ